MDHGEYRLTFPRSFSALPTIVVNEGRLGFPVFVQVNNVTVASAEVYTRSLAADFTYVRVDTQFHFIAIGPR